MNNEISSSCADFVSPGFWLIDVGGVNAGDVNAGDVNAGGVNARGVNAGGVNAGGVNAGGVNGCFFVSGELHDEADVLRDQQY
jgi:hypothetical protein